MNALCVFPGCTDVGVIAGESASTDTYVPAGGLLCFPHAFPPAPPAEVDDQADAALEVEPVELVADAGAGFHTDVVNGLAAMLLEHAAMTFLEAEDATGDAMRSLALNTGWTNDVAAGALLALTYIAAAGGVDDAELLHGAEVYEQMVADLEADDQAAGELADRLEPTEADLADEAFAADVEMADIEDWAAGRTDEAVEVEVEVEAAEAEA